MIRKKVKTSRSSTFSQVFRFWLTTGIFKIPKEHHYNMLMGIGCKDRTLKKFIANYHFFDEASVIDAIIDSQKQKKSILDKDFLVNHFATEHSVYGGDVQNEIAKAKGVDWMLEKGFLLENVIIKNHIKNASDSLLKSLVPYAHLLKKAEVDVFKSGYAPLVISYLENAKKIQESNIYELLAFDDLDVYGALFDNHSYKISDELIEAILNTKSVEIIKKLVKYIKLNENQEILLIKKGVFDLIKIQLDSFGYCVSDVCVDYIACSSSDEFFRDFVKLGKLDVYEEYYYYPDSFYERLFKIDDKELLMFFIKASFLPSKFERELLKLGDEKLIKSYFGEDKQCYTNKAAIHIFEEENADNINELLDSNCSIGYFGEAWLFKSGRNDYIKRYLENRNLTHFGEGCLIKYADKDIVLEYLNDEVILGNIAFVSAMERKDKDIIKRMIELIPYFYEEERQLEAFLLNASNDTITSFFENMDEREYASINIEVSKELARKVFLTRDLNVQKSFINWFDLSNEKLSNVLGEFAHRDIVIEQILRNDEFSCEVIKLIKRRDMGIIKAFLKENKFESEDEEMEFILLMDENMILEYAEKIGFSYLDISIIDEI